MLAELGMEGLSLKVSALTEENDKKRLGWREREREREREKRV